VPVNGALAFFIFGSSITGNSINRQQHRPAAARSSVIPPALGARPPAAAPPAGLMHDPRIDISSNGT
jgi:hypothetical protein